MLDIEWIHLQRKLKNEKKKPRHFLKMYCRRWEMESKHGEVIDKRTHLEDSVRWGKDNGNDDEKIPRWAASRMDEINSSHFLTTLVQVQNLKQKSWKSSSEEQKKNKAKEITYKEMDIQMASLLFSVTMNIRR